MDDRTELGREIEEALKEGIAYRRGEVALETRILDPMPPERVKAIRKAVARSTAEFQRRFGVPAATMNNWEQGRRAPDLTARILLTVIERDPEAVRRALESA